MSNFNRIGEGYLISYRDPNLKKTMDVYEGVVDYLENFSVSDRDMNKFVIGTISNIDRPMNPAAKGSRSMNLYMNHVSEEMIRTERNQILDMDQADIRALADVLRGPGGTVAVRHRKRRQDRREQRHVHGNKDTELNVKKCEPGRSKIEFYYVPNRGI